MAELKTQLTKVKPTAFLKTIQPEQKRKDCLELIKIFEGVTKQKAQMWGPAIIGFGKFHYASERSTQQGDWFLTGFSPRAANITLYVTATAPEQKANLKKLGKHKLSGSCVHIKTLADVNLPALKQVIATSVKVMKKRYSVK